MSCLLPLRKRPVAPVTCKVSQKRHRLLAAQTITYTPHFPLTGFPEWPEPAAIALLTAPGLKDGDKVARVLAGTPGPGALNSAPGLFALDIPAHSHYLRIMASALVPALP